MAEYCRSIFGAALLTEPLDKYPVGLGKIQGILGKLGGFGGFWGVSEGIWGEFGALWGGFWGDIWVNSLGFWHSWSRGFGGDVLWDICVDFGVNFGVFGTAGAGGAPAQPPGAAGPDPHQEQETAPEGGPAPPQTQR